MKCQLCDGKGEYMHAIGGYRLCEYCNGTGKIVLTNEEWFGRLNTEEKAEFLFDIACMCSYCGDEAHRTKEKIQQCHFGKCCCQKQDWVKWLKQPHKEKRE